MIDPLLAVELCVSTEGSCGGTSSLLTPAIALVSALIGAGATYWIRRSDWRREDERQRREREWHQERETLARELLVAAPLDDALVEVQRRLTGRDVPPEQTPNQAAHNMWQEAWIRYSPRVGDAEVEARFKAVGTMLLEVTSLREGQRLGMQRACSDAIANARIALGYFMRDEELPPNAFPHADELIRLLGQGDGTNTPLGPLLRWLDAHPLPPWRGATQPNARA